jgi:hypothetical protein
LFENCDTLTQALPFGALYKADMIL